MKAIRVHQHGDPDVMRIEEMPDPTPSTGEILIRIKAIGVNPVDTYIRSGKNNYTAKMPYTPGLDAAGIVESAGDSVTLFKKGDRVYCSGSITGTYAEKTLCKVEQVFPLPPSLTFEQGAAIGTPYGTAYRALFHIGEAKQGETVLIHGASGGVGIAAVQLGLWKGLQIIGTSSQPEHQKRLKDMSVDLVVDHSDPKHMDKVMEYTNGKGVNVIIEMLANANLGMDLPALVKKGRVVVVGSRGDVVITPRNLMSRDASIRGMAMGNASPEEKADIFSEIRKGLELKKLVPFVGLELPLEEAAEAHKKVLGPHAFGKIILGP